MLLMLLLLLRPLRASDANFSQSDKVAAAAAASFVLVGQRAYTESNNFAQLDTFAPVSSLDLSENVACCCNLRFFLTKSNACALFGLVCVCVCAARLLLLADKVFLSSRLTRKLKATFERTDFWSQTRPIDVTRLLMFCVSLSGSAFKRLE